MIWWPKHIISNLETWSLARNSINPAEYHFPADTVCQPWVTPVRQRDHFRSWWVFHPFRISVLFDIVRGAKFYAWWNTPLLRFENDSTNLSLHRVIYQSWNTERIFSRWFFPSSINVSIYDWFASKMIDLKQKATIYPTYETQRTKWPKMTLQNELGSLWLLNLCFIRVWRLAAFQVG